MPGPTSAKNAALTLGAASADLGLSEYLDAQLINEEERRRRLREGQRDLPSNFGDAVMGNAAMSLFTGVKT